ncbi:MAG: hypothetical protein LBH59_01170, partial [Planctomycetaceae bacterium]|nr:hypothetical protein [Planctomycetaceae bacterium]
ISVSILPELQQHQSQNLSGEVQLPAISNLAQFINIASFLDSSTQFPATILRADTLTGNIQHTTSIPEYNLATTQNLIQKFSTNPNYLCTIIMWNNGIEIL